MIEKNYPRILIIGPPFNNSTGSGITLSNLFKGWPIEKISVASSGHDYNAVTTDICNTYYQLGKEEHRWKFPFNLIQRPFTSGLKTFQAKMETRTKFKKKGIRYFIINHFFYPFLQYIGLSHCLSKFSLSQKLKNWLTYFQPEVLYIIVETRETLLFASEVVDYLKIPTAIHMMDDWPSTISNKGLLKKYWRTKIDKEFRQLLDRMDLFLSISDAMSDEYLKRYQKHFIVFHNPINISKFNQVKRDDSILKGTFKILYTGRIGIANRQALKSFAKAISQYKIEKFEVILDIFSPNSNNANAKIFRNFNRVKIEPGIPNNEVFSLLVKYDLLLLPLDFTEVGLNFAKLSMPTKASEYMMSGRPILIFAPYETAVSKFFTQNECGYCVTKDNTEEIINAINFLISNVEYRNKISQNALRIAKDKFEAEKVRYEFQQLLINVSKGENYFHSD